MKARLVVSSWLIRSARGLTDQPSTRSGSIEQRVLSSEDDLDSDTSDSTAGQRVRLVLDRSAYAATTWS
jgi:hypothetical protein